MSLDYIRYWRNDLLESEMFDPQDQNQGETFKIKFAEATSGLITDPDILAKITAIKTAKDKWNQSETIDVIIGMYQVVANRYEHRGRFKSFYLLWKFAILNHVTGELIPASERLPYIPRTYLAPQENPSRPFAGSLSVMTDYWHRHSTEFSDWQAYHNYGKKLMNRVVPKDFYDSYKVGENAILLLDDSVLRPARHITSNLNYILNKRQTPPLLQELCSGITESVPTKSLSPTDLLNGSLWHVGQMSSKYPLAPSQREALQYFLNMNDREILAVNGPPGTGKTSLIHSVIASLWVRAAYHQLVEPPIIVISSSNNKAVSNAIDSFGRSFGSDDIFSKRWLPPPVKDFGLYMISNLTLNDRPDLQDKYHCHTPSTFWGTPIECEGYIEAAKKYYFEHYKNYYGEVPENLQNTITKLRDKLGNLVHEIQAPINGRIKTLVTLAQLAHETGLDEHDLINNAREIVDEQMEESRQVLNGLRASTDQIQELRNDKEAEYLRLTRACQEIRSHIKPGILSSIKNAFKKSAPDFNLKSFLEQENLFKYLPPGAEMTPDQVLDSLEGAARQLSDSVAEWDITIAEQLKQTLKLNTRIATVDNYCTLYLDAVADWENEYSQYSSCEDWESSLDKKRHEAFLLAMHYWEARWLVTTDDYWRVAQERIPNQFSYKETVARYKRYAMLMPGMVSTLYMAPRFLNYLEDHQYVPLINHIDLLIVDEAGQTLPSIASASFACAKKALVLGDIEQIKPVVQTARRIDNTNLVKCGLVKSTDFEEQNQLLFDQEHLKGYTVTEGNVMRLAQQACKYKAVQSPNDGVFLREHFRCYDEIINICNDLSYDGKLLPQRGPNPGTYAPALGYLHIDGTSINQGGSRTNQREAFLAAQWIKKFSGELLEHYPGKELGEIIAVITPFKSQAKLIQEEFKKAEISKVEAGTVHTFQGGEKDIILFSSVYDNPGESLFMLNDSVNLVNVAISRARDSFIFFGNTSILENPGRGTRALKEHILERGVSIAKTDKIKIPIA